MIWRGVYITFLHQQKIELVEKYKIWIWKLPYIHYRDGNQENAHVVMDLNRTT